jgi:hypothetical protein
MAVADISSGASAAGARASTDGAVPDLAGV